MDQYEPGTGLYNIPAAWRVSGELDRDALEQSLNEIVRRHEVLRTCFAAADDVPVQVIAEALLLRLELTDLSQQADAERQAQGLVQQEAERAFDLSRGPLIRASLIRLAPQEHIFLLTLHHVIADGWSIGVLMRELCALYRAFSQGQASPLTELPIQYADYA
ncbi:MAG: condensation domain-containing protein, partial [bacterium]